MTYFPAADDTRADTRADTRDTASCVPGLLWPMLFPYRAAAPRHEQPLPQRNGPGYNGSGHNASGRESRRQDAQLRAKSP